MILVVAAHPDDEIIGLGAQLPYLPDVLFVHVTDGAPRNMIDARAHGFASREEYARQRRNEALQALSAGHIEQERCRDLAFADQETTANLPLITAKLYQLIREARPHYVVTHPYEGGHPDHDSTAFACYTARRLLMRERRCPGILVEFTSYHVRDGRRVAGEFLPSSTCEVITCILLPQQQAFKKYLFSCFPTQQTVLADFPTNIERFRVAPDYDFRKPPHEGPLYYENFPWGMTGLEWRRIATAALRQLEL
jgi:hypothetical protein